MYKFKKTLKNWSKKSSDRTLEVVRYTIAGFITTFITLFVYYLGTQFFLDPYDPVELQIINIFSWICGFAFAYIANRKYVFRSEREDVLKEAGSFLISRLATLLTDMGLMHLFVSVLSYSDRTFKIVVTVIVIIANYLTGHLLVFTKRKKVSHSGDY